MLIHMQYYNIYTKNRKINNRPVSGTELTRIMSKDAINVRIHGTTAHTDVPTRRIRVRRVYVV